MSIGRLPVLVLSALALCLGALAPAAAQSEAREFKNHNFKWTLPEGWTFRNVSAEAKKFGHVIAADSPTKDVQVTVFASKTDLGAEDRLHELKGALRQFLQGNVEDSKTISSTVLGHPCKALIASGTHQSGASGQVRLYVLGTRGFLYHLEVVSFNDGIIDRREEVNAMRKGFQLIKGAKDGHKDEDFNEFGGASASGSDDGGDDGWPAKGPKREGDKVIFGDMNIEWSLKGTPFRWDKPIKDISKAWEKTDRGISYRRVIEVVGSVERKKKEFEKDTPDRNAARGLFFIYPLPGGRDTEEALRSSRLQKEIQRNWGLSEINAGKTRVNTDVTIGSLKGKGGFLMLDAKLRNGIPSTIMYFEVQLQGWMYMWQFLLQGHTDRTKDFAPIIGKMLKNNITFPDDNEHVAGPFLGPEGIPTFSGKRGKHKDREKTMRTPGGITFVKPEGFVDLEATKRGNPDVRLAVEARSEDGSAYIYFDIHTWPAAMLQKKMMKIETMADKRVGAWKAGGGDDALLSKKGKPPFLKKGGKLFKLKGDYSYYFKAKKDGVPYVEQGVWGKNKQYVIWMRVQYGGENAEKKMKRLAKAINKGMKIK